MVDREPLSSLTSISARVVRVGLGMLCKGLIAVMAATADVRSQVRCGAKVELPLIEGAGAESSSFDLAAAVVGPSLLSLLSLGIRNSTYTHIAVISDRLRGPVPLQRLQLLLPQFTLTSNQQRGAN